MVQYFQSCDTFSQLVQLWLSQSRTNNFSKNCLPLLLACCLFYWWRVELGDKGWKILMTFLIISIFTFLTDIKTVLSVNKVSRQYKIFKSQFSQQLLSNHVQKSSCSNIDPSQTFRGSSNNKHSILMTNFLSCNCLDIQSIVEV